MIGQKDVQRKEKTMRTYSSLYRMMAGSLLFGSTCLIAGDANRTEVTGVKTAIAMRNRIINENLELLEKVSVGAKSFSKAEVEAVGILGAYRSDEAAQVLVKLIEVSRYGAASITAVEPKVVSMEFPTEQYPCVNTLGMIGTPAVYAICRELNSTEPKHISSSRLDLYVEVVHHVLPGRVGVAFCREMRREAPDELQERYDPLIKRLETAWRPAIKFHTITLDKDFVPPARLP